MNGLFETLIAAAQGGVSGISHRPRQRFDGAQSSFAAEVSSETYEQTEASFATKGLQNAPEQVVGTPTDQSIINQAPGALAPPKSERPTRLQPSSNFSTPAKTTNDQTRRAFASPPANVVSSEDDPRRGDILLQRDLKPPLADDHRTAKAASLHIDASDQTLFRPDYSPQNVPIAQTETQTEYNPTTPDKAADQRERDAPKFELRIGRIEVTNPPARTIAPAHQSRPVIIPRARPRQSLDDYLRGRKH